MHLIFLNLVVFDIENFFIFLILHKYKYTMKDLVHETLHSLSFYGKKEYWFQMNQTTVKIKKIFSSK